MGLTTRRAEWAALVPWAGLQGAPEWVGNLNNPVGRPILLISDVEGLAAALAGIPPDLSLAAVAYSGQYSDLLGAPVLGSAAFANTSLFQLAPLATTLQINSEPLVSGQQDYTVVFTETMENIPKIETQVFMDDDSGEMFHVTVPDDSVTTTGFKFWLNGVPTASAGRVQWRAFIQTQP